jgi:hypothetical protein
MLMRRTSIARLAEVRGPHKRPRPPQRDPWQEFKVRLIFVGVAALLAILAALFQAEPAAQLPAADGSGAALTSLR